MTNIMAFIHYNGRCYEGYEGFMFEGEKRAIQIYHAITYEELKRNISDKLRLRRDQHISKLTSRLLVNENPTKYVEYVFYDDSDIQCFMNYFAMGNMRVIDIYANIDVAGSSSCLIEPNTNEMDNDLTESDDEDWHRDMEGDFTEDEEEAQYSYVNSDDSEEEEAVNISLRSQPAPAMPTFQGCPNPEIADLDYGPFPLHTPHSRYINWHHPDQEMDSREVDASGSWVERDGFYVGLRFNSKDAVLMAIKQYSMRAHQTYTTVESKPTKIYLKCPKHVDGCQWKMRAILPKADEEWVVKTWGGPHTCVNTMVSQDHAKLDSNVVASHIHDLICAAPSTSIKAIQAIIKKQYKFQISYRKAWIAKRKAIEKFHGDWDFSYAMLPAWMENMLIYAPGSYYQIQERDAYPLSREYASFRIFERVFWTFKQCRDAFQFSKPIIQVDGTHLYGKYRGVLLIATSQDGNDQVLPLAFAIVEGETASAWEWFLAHIREHVTNKQGLCLISDRHRSILSVVRNEALGWQPPWGYHKFCIRHIGSNFNTKFKNEKLKKLLKNTGYATSKETMERRLNRLRSQSDEIKKWVDDIPKEQWLLACDENGRRYGHMTTNLSECVNKLLKDARSLPITALVRWTYNRLVEYFVERGSKARAEYASGHRFSKVLRDVIDNARHQASSHDVRRYNIAKTRFQVDEEYDPIKQTGGRSFSVDLERQLCECGSFQLFHFPCSHVIAACASVRMDFSQYVDDVYKLTTIIRAYSPEWYPIQNEHQVASTHVVPWMLMPDPKMQRNKGRPKSTRIRNEMDWKESQPPPSCSLCNQVGHNRRRCPHLASGSCSAHTDDEYGAADL